MGLSGHKCCCIKDQDKTARPFLWTRLSLARERKKQWYAGVNRFIRYGRSQDPSCNLLIKSIRGPAVLGIGEGPESKLTIYEKRKERKLSTTSNEDYGLYN